MNNTGVSSYGDDTPFGVDEGFGKAKGDLPSLDDFASASPEELERYIDFIGLSIGQREKELKANRNNLSPKEKKGHREKIANEERSKKGAKAELGVKNGLKEAEKDSTQEDSDESE